MEKKKEKKKEWRCEAKEKRRVIKKRKERSEKEQLMWRSGEKEKARKIHDVIH